MSKTFLLFIFLGLLLPQLHSKLIVGDNFVKERHVKRGDVPVDDIQENGEGVLDFWDFDPSTGDKIIKKTTKKARAGQTLDQELNNLLDELASLVDGKTKRKERYLAVSDSEDDFENNEDSLPQDSPNEEENFEEIGEEANVEEEEEDEDNTGGVPQEEDEEDDDEEEWEDEENDEEEWEDDSDDEEEWEEWEDEEDDEEEWEDDSDDDWEEWEDEEEDDSDSDYYQPQEALASLGVYVRYGMEMDDFQEFNGRRQFLDGLSNGLLIRPETILIQRIREGSVIIEFEIIVPKEDGVTQDAANAQIRDIAAELDNVIEDIFDGVEVLDYQKNIFTSEPQKVNNDDGANAAVGIVAGLCAVVLVVMLYFICKQKTQLTSNIAKQKAYHPSLPDSEVNLDLENHVNEVYNGAQRGEDDSVNMYKIN